MNRKGQGVIAIFLAIVFLASLFGAVPVAFAHPQPVHNINTGAEEKVQKVQLISPHDCSRVYEFHPCFKWYVSPDTRDYTLIIRDAMSGQLHFSTTISITNPEPWHIVYNYRYPSSAPPFKRTKTYSWQVTTTEAWSSDIWRFTYYGGPVCNIDTGETFATIQAAINDPDTLNGHTITVDPGTYSESPEVTKQLTIRSTSGDPTNTIVWATGYYNGFLIWADYVTISGFTIKGAHGWLGSGIELRNADYCTFSNNILSENWGGIYLYNSSNNVIINNDVSNNDVVGIPIWQFSSNNIIAYNNVSDNCCGIELCDSSNNYIYCNNFINNPSYNVASYGYANANANTWNSPEVIAYIYNGNLYVNYLGNYWDDYTGSDTNGDGIGDTTPYVIIGDNDDNYPLVERFENYVLCAVGEALYRGNVSSPEEKINSLRELRDDFLRDNYVNLYYEYNPEIRRILIEEPYLLIDAANLLVTYIPAVNYVSGEGGEDLKIEEEDVKEAISFIENLKKEIWERREEIGIDRSSDIIEFLDEFEEQVKASEGKMFSQALRDSIYARWPVNETEYLNSITQPIDVSKIHYKFKVVDEEWAAKWTNEILYVQMETKYSIAVYLNKTGYVTGVDFERWGFPIAEIPVELAAQSLAKLDP